jgi:hypothetical protein
VSGQTSVVVRRDAERTSIPLMLTVQDIREWLANLDEQVGRNNLTDEAPVIVEHTGDPARMSNIKSISAEVLLVP